MLADPDALKAVRKEADGLESKGTWDLGSVRECDAVREEAKKKGVKIHLGNLMSICSIKFAELARDLQILKGRIVYRGDCAKDEWGAAAIYQELAASPTSIQAANSNIAYGLFPGNKTTTADAVKAYVQSALKSKHPTWISLPPELWPADWKGKYKKPIVRLIKSLYGHPESGAHWEKHLEDILRKEFDARPVDGHPSSYFMTDTRLMLTVYVDDLVLSGPADKHEDFWGKLRTLVDVEDVTPLERFLGRHHEFGDGTIEDFSPYVKPVPFGDTPEEDSRKHPVRGVRFDMTAYARQAVDMYTASTGVSKLRYASTPFCPEGSLVAADDEEEGEVSHAACAILMKMLWLGRLARPDIIRAIAGLASKVQKWTRNCDKQLYRLACYLHTSADYKLNAYIGDPPDKLKLRLYADADFAGDNADARSTSGGYLVVIGPNSFFPLSWVSKKQTSTSRSTTESEIVSLAHCIYSEALPMLNFFDLLIGGEGCPWEACEDNEATIKVVKNGYSAKLRHISRTHKVNISSLKEILEGPGDGEWRIRYIGTKEQAADIFTKALGPQLWGPALDMLNIVQHARGA